MKVKVDWAALGKALWAAIKPVLLGAVGAGLVVITNGCTNMSTTPRGQTTEIVAVGVPAVAWITHTTQTAEHNAGDTYDVDQSTTNGVVPSVSLAK